MSTERNGGDKLEEKKRGIGVSLKSVRGEAEEVASALQAESFAYYLNNNPRQSQSKPPWLM
jgi:hypothetical protein